VDARLELEAVVAVPKVSYVPSGLGATLGPTKSRVANDETKSIKGRRPRQDQISSSSSSSSQVPDTTDTMRFSKVATLVTVVAAPFVVQAQLIDVCANVNINLLGLLGIINLGGLLNVCLCLSALPGTFKRLFDQ